MSDENHIQLLMIDTVFVTLKAKTIFDLFTHTEDYPENIAERGVPQDTCYHFVSSTFLNGLINYVKPFYAVITKDNTDITELATIYNKFDNKTKDSTRHTYYMLADSDVIVLAESFSSYWLFWSDQDVSDCVIGRILKDSFTQDDIKQFLLNHFTDKNMQYIELTMPKGWITF